MKILLIDPPYTIFTGYDCRYFPVGLSYVGSVLAKNDHEVIIYEADRERSEVGDINFSEEYKRLENYRKEINNVNHFIWKKIANLVEDFKPDIIGITAMTMSFGSVIKTAEVCKKVKPETKIIVGGPHATDWPEICLQSPYVDFCISGEAEEVIIPLINSLDDKLSYLNKNIPGLSYKENGELKISKKKPFCSNLNLYPYPARELLVNSNCYSSEDMGVIMTSRGCPYNCGFCSHPPKVRYRNLDNVIKEIKYVADKYETRQFAIKDDSFTVNRKRTIEFCKKINEEGLNINWDCTTRVNLIDDELLDIMQGAGCNIIKVGIETGSERILKEVNKGITFGQAKIVADLLNKHGIFWSAYFMYGLPTEAEEDMFKTLEFMKELNPPYAGLGLYAPMPNTKLWEKGIKLKLINPDISIEHFFNTNPKDYFFKDPKVRTINIGYEKFTELSNYLMEEFNKHNISYINLLRRAWARRLIYYQNPKLMIKDINKAYRWLKN